jgi:hypothetical protein
MITKIDSNNIVSRFNNQSSRSVVLKENDILIVANQMQSFAIRSNHVEVYPVENFIYGETPSPSVNGAQLVFTTANSYIAGTLVVTRGTLRMHPTSDFTETSSTTFTMALAPESNEPLIVDYIKA